MDQTQGSSTRKSRLSVLARFLDKTQTVPEATAYPPHNSSRQALGALGEDTEPVVERSTSIDELDADGDEVDEFLAQFLNTSNTRPIQSTDGREEDKSDLGDDSPSLSCSEDSEWQSAEENEAFDRVLLKNIQHSEERPTLNSDLESLFGGSDAPNYSNEVLDKCLDYNSAVLYYEQYFESDYMYDSFEDFVGQLAYMLQSRFEDLKDPEDIKRAIEFEEVAIESLTVSADRPRNETDIASHYDGLGKSFRLRFEQSRVRDDIDKAISLQQKAVDMMPDDHIDKPSMLYSLSQSFESRFKHYALMEDIDQAISAQRQAVDLETSGGKPRRLSNLGDLYVCRFEYSRERVDIDNSIATRQQATDLTPQGDEDMPAMLSNLGTSFLSRFEHFSELSDVNKAISLLLQAVKLTRGGHRRLMWLQNLGGAYTQRFEYAGDPDDIDNAITARQTAVDAIQDTHPDKPAMLSNLGHSLQRRFETLGHLKDIDTAISIQRQAANLTSDHSYNKPTWLQNLGGALTRRFERLGELKDVDDAITVQKQALSLTPIGHPDKPARLSNLGGSYASRFQRLGDLDDIHATINYRQQAVALAPDGHAEKPGWLSNLGSSLALRFERLGKLDDIDSAITVQRQAVELIPIGHTDRPSIIMNLGTWFLRRFQRLGCSEDIDAAISFHQQAVDIVPNSHAKKPGMLNSLAASLRDRYERFYKVNDIHNAIIVQQHAVDLTPNDHEERATRFSNLGLLFMRRYQHSPNSKDLDNTVKAFRTAATSVTGKPTIRFYSAQHWAKLTGQLEPHRVVVDLIPRVVWFGRTVHQRYQDLEAVGAAAMEAAEAACKAEEFELALEWLEQGRSIVWGQILQLRSPMDELAAVDKDLADKLGDVAAALESAGTADTSQFKLGATDNNLEERAQAHRRLAESWEDLLKQARAKPKFRYFLRSKPTLVLKETARDGPIITINVGEDASDALIIKPNSTYIDHVHLPHLSYKKAKAAQDSLLKSLHGVGVRQVEDTTRMSVPSNAGNRGPLKKILSMLWSDVTKPILDRLGLLPQTLSPSQDLLHITWCLTGPLASLPLHAAGLYDESGPKSKLFNYVVSSYTPSLTALLEASHKQSLQNLSGLLALTQSSTPGLSRLPGTMKEVDEVEKQVRLADRRLTRLDGEKATVAAVSQGMNEHSWVHFSCHGKQDALEPTKSAFHLYDGTLELAEIMKKPLEHAELAYLSACQTASGDAKLPDEAVHLAAGMFIAGYKTVVATLWSIRDNEAPLVANVFYQGLLNHPEAGAARVLHEAVSVLRKQAGEKDFMAWVPYIHIGH